MKNGLKLFGAMICLVMSIVAHHFGMRAAQLQRVEWFSGGAAVLLLGLAIFLCSVEGAALKVLVRGALKEWGRISWPSRREASMITVVVFLLSCISSFLIWLMDCFFSYSFGFVTGFMG